MTTDVKVEVNVSKDRCGVMVCKRKEHPEVTSGVEKVAVRGMLVSLPEYHDRILRGS